MKVYTLTRLTRRIDEQRRVVIQGFEIRARVLKVVLIGAIPAAVVAGIAAAIVGIYSLFVFVAVDAAFYALLEVRTRRGLQLVYYKSILDRTRSKVGSFAVSGVVIDPLETTWGYVVASSRPATRPADSTVADRIDSLLRPEGA